MGQGSTHATSRSRYARAARAWAPLCPILVRSHTKPCTLRIRFRRSSEHVRARDLVEPLDVRARNTTEAGPLGQAWAAIEAERAGAEGAL